MTEQGVELFLDESGRAQLRIVGDGAVLRRFHDLLREEAAKLAALGDTSPVQERMARALGVLADRQTALDLSAGSQVAWYGWARDDSPTTPALGGPTS